MRKIWGLVLFMCMLSGCSGRIEFPVLVTKKTTYQDGSCSIEVSDGLENGVDVTSRDVRYCTYQVGQEIK